MKVALFEPNLLWSSKLTAGLRSLGHEIVTDEAEVAFVSLSQDPATLRELVSNLLASGVKVIGHAGHKEEDILALGRSLDCSLVVTNGKVALNLPAILLGFEPNH